MNEPCEDENPAAEESEVLEPEFEDEFVEETEEVEIIPSNVEQSRSNMDKYECIACGYIYDPAIGDPDNGIEPGTSFDDLPEDWVCPECGVGKDQFEKI